MNCSPFVWMEGTNEQVHRCLHLFYQLNCGRIHIRCRSLYLRQIFGFVITSYILLLLENSLRDERQINVFDHQSVSII